jgi:peptide/nickel transport system permease protein
MGPRLREMRRGAASFRKSLIAVVGLVIIGSFIAIGLLAPLLAPPPPGTRNPYEMSQDFSEEYCPASAAFTMQWAWTVNRIDVANHTVDITLTMPQLGSPYSPRDIAFEVQVLDERGRPLRAPPAPGSHSFGPLLPVDFYVNGSLRYNVTSGPADIQRFPLDLDAGGEWVVEGRESRGEYTANVTWRLLVPPGEGQYPLERAPLTRVIIRPDSVDIHLAVQPVRDCAGLVVGLSQGAQSRVTWVVGNTTLEQNLGLRLLGGHLEGATYTATLSRPAHNFGTTVGGMDIYYGVVWGSQISMRIGLMVVAFSLAIGILLGLFAGYYGGWVDELLMRLTDVFFGIPALILAMVVIVSIGPTIDNLVLALVAVSWPSYSRLIRGVTLTVKNNLYVEAARASGTRSGTILRRHILPNTVSPMMVQGTLDIGSVVLVAAGLSFIGFSFASPQTTEWGRMVYDGQQIMGASSFRVVAPVFYPGLAIFLFVLGFNMLGDGLRDVLDPRLRR